MESKRIQSSGWFNHLLKPVLLSLVLLVLTAATAAALTVSELKGQLNSEMGKAGGFSSAYVYDTTTDKPLFGSKSGVKRIPASVNKLFTTTTALVKLGPETRLKTVVKTDGTLTAEGVVTGNIYLIGAGDPTFGSDAFIKSRYGTGTSITDLANSLSNAGVKEIDGKVYGDESSFDSVRGTSASGWATSPYVGPLSALTYNSGYDANGFQSSPPEYAAKQFRKALKKAGIKFKRSGTAAKITPTEALELASIESPHISTVVKLINRPSDNFLAEMMVKTFGSLLSAKGSTKAGTKIVKATMSEFDIKPKVVDGSGLSRSNKTTAKQVVKLLKGMTIQPTYDVFYSSLASPGEAGTLKKRMRGTAADGRCRAKTGTLSNVSALAGYCTAKNGHRIAFAFIMNGVSPFTARPIQDRMTVAIANYN